MLALGDRDAYGCHVQFFPSIASIWLATLLRSLVVVAIGTSVARVVAMQNLHPLAVTALVVCPLLIGAVEWWQARSYGPKQAKIERELRRPVLQTAWNRGSMDRSARQSGRAVSLATDTVERTAAMRASFTAPMIAQMTAPIVVLVVMAFAVGVKQAVILMIGLPLIPIMVGGFQRIFASVSGRHRAASAQLANEYLEAIQGLTDLRLIGAGLRFGKKLARGSEALRQQVMKMLAANQVVILVADAGFALGMLIVAVWQAITGYSAGTLGLGPALTLVLLAPLLMEPLNHIGKFFYVGMGGRAASKALKAYTAEQPANEAGEDRDANTHTEATPITVQGLSFTWDDGAQALSTIDFSVTAGEHVVLTGESGGGKSTLLSLIAGLAEPSEGQILLDGAPATAAERRSLCAMVRQSAFLFTGTLAENLRIARPDATEDEMWRALDQANLGEALQWSGGLHTLVGERGLEVSGGQAQRIAIARAFLRDAPILLLDEPTSQVDLSSEMAIREALAVLCEGRTVITVAHREALVESADRAIEIHEGKVSA
ncbi:MAG: ABC transporter ATP-binding protein/permease [Ancrocorticia sp.]|uniref:ABC transporter ATP-binding protein/permease n=1 Tax=Ancrocorticia sp. TaxID=2593684 RepID=UPI003F8F45C0